ncbi:hypothetical protein LguiA_013347 [Lonicera macranthoides]
MTIIIITSLYILSLLIRLLVSALISVMSKSMARITFNIGLVVPPFTTSSTSASRVRVVLMMGI